MKSFYNPSCDSFVYDLIRWVGVGWMVFVNGQKRFHIFHNFASQKIYMLKLLYYYHIMIIMKKT